jgi:hypothetical protein
MGGVIDDEIVVERDAARLIAFVWQGQRYPVGAMQVMGTPPTRWWDGQGERTYLRVTAKGQLYELYFDHERKVWVLARKL